MASDQGDPDGMLNYADILANGKGVPRDLEHAARLYQLAVQRGSAPALERLGMMMIHGCGVKQNIEHGKHLIQAAVDKGMKYAHRNLGKLAEEGIGGPVNMAVAFQHYKLAAEANDTMSTLRMAKMLIKGQGCQKEPA
jgi:TPR repeat protein